jgi:hypothetical protein
MNLIIHVGIALARGVLGRVLVTCLLVIMGVGLCYRTVTVAAGRGR